MTDPQRAEALDGAVTFEFNGDTFSFDVNAVSIDALEDAENDKIIRATKSIIGDEQWARYKAANPAGITLGEFWNAILKATQAKAEGNSAASPVS